ncbi:hypothetical protein ACA910_013842 [Epithemia clementina (nom. ined.)]
MHHQTLKKMLWVGTALLVGLSIAVTAQQPPRIRGSTAASPTLASPTIYSFSLSPLDQDDTAEIPSTTTYSSPRDNDAYEEMIAEMKAYYNAIQRQQRRRQQQEQEQQQEPRRLQGRDLNTDTSSGEEETTTSNLEPTPSPRVQSDIELMLVEQYRSGLIFFNESSYSMRALRFVEQTSTSSMPNWRIANRYALACIHYATSGVVTDYSLLELGQLSFNWLNPWPMDASNECTWHGVTCTNNVTDAASGHVYGNITELDLHSNWLMGTFPNEVIYFKETLQNLDLELNVVSNVGPANLWWLAELTQLRKLNLKQTNFNNENNGLPTELRSLVQLQQLDLYRTNFFGPFDDSTLQPLINLEYLDMGGIAFNNRPALPSSLRSMPNLLYVYLDYSDFIGDLGTYFDGATNTFPSLIEFWADFNPMTSTNLPSTLGAYTTIRSFSVTSCGLTGTIPTELGNLVQLKSLWLYNNTLSGGVPSELANIPTLERIYVHDNDLQGTMPTEVCMRRFGTLQSLGADCQVVDGTTTTTPEMTCNDAGPNTPCCTCCGSECVIA